MSESTPILEMRKINKHFPGVKALSDVDFRLFQGEVHAIMGQNGAGKVHADQGAHRRVQAGLRGNPAGGQAHPVRTRPSPPRSWESAPCTRRSTSARTCRWPRTSSSAGSRCARADRLEGAQSPGRGGPEEAERRHRRHPDALVLLHRHPADGGHRPGAGRLLQDPDPGRADLQPRRERGGAALQGHPQAAGRGTGHPLHHPLPRPDLPDLRPDHGPEERRVRRRVQDRRACPSWS